MVKIGNEIIVNAVANFTALLKTYLKIAFEKCQYYNNILHFLSVSRATTSGRQYKITQ
jgi:hypothetical protein